MPLFTRPFVLLCVAELGYFTADGLAIYALPLYVTGPVGSNRAGAGIAFGAFALSALVLRPVAGRLCDTVGRYPLLIAGAGISAVGLLATAYVESLALVVALRVLLGVGEAAFFVAAFAALADLAPAERLGEALSYNSLSLYLGLALGPLIGEWVASELSIRDAWFAAASLALLAAVASLAVGETLDRHAAVSGGTRRLIHWPAIPVGLGFLASVVPMAGFLTFASLRATELDLTNASLPLVVYGLTVVACRLVFAKVPDRVPSLPLGAAALAAIGVGLLVAALWPRPAGLLLGAFVMAVGVAFSTPAFFSAIFATASAAERGAASATASILLDLGLGAGPLLLGFVAESLGIPWAFGAAAGVALVGVGWVSRLARGPSPATPEARRRRTRPAPQRRPGPDA